MTEHVQSKRILDFFGKYQTRASLSPPGLAVARQRRLALNVKEGDSVGWNEETYQVSVPYIKCAWSHDPSPYHPLPDFLVTEANKLLYLFNLGGFGFAICTKMHQSKSKGNPLLTELSFGEKSLRWHLPQNTELFSPAPCLCTLSKRSDAWLLAHLYNTWPCAGTPGCDLCV